MASPSVSFRISRSAEDLAGTLHLLSQRLVLLEQRLEALEGQRQEVEEDDPALAESLGNAERLLLDCRALLGGALDDGVHPSPAIAPVAPEAVEIASMTRQRRPTGAGPSDPDDGFEDDEAVAVLDDEADVTIEPGNRDGDEDGIDRAAA